MAKNRQGRIELKPRDFAGHAHMSPGYVSNGHWIIKRAALANEALYRTEDGATAVLGEGVVTARYRPENDLARTWLKDGATVEGYTVTKFLWEPSTSGQQWRLLQAVRGGSLTELDEKYAQAFGVQAGDVLYCVVPAEGQPRGATPLFNDKTGNMATWAIMPGQGVNAAVELIHQLLAPRVEAVPSGDDPTHPKVPAGYCDVCHHYGDDCTGSAGQPVPSEGGTNASHEA